MPKTINVEKIYNELDKGTPDEMYSAVQTIKGYVGKKMEDAQKQAEDKASELQSKIEKLNNGKQ